MWNKYKPIIVFGSIFLLVGMLTFQSYRLSIRTNQLNNSSTEIELLKYKLSNKQDSLNLLQLEAQTLRNISDSLVKETVKLEKVTRDLNIQLEKALSKIDSIPPGESYEFLQNVAYNYEGTLEYPFNSIQVTEIHKSYVENEMIKSINVNLATTINVLNRRIGIQDSLIYNQHSRLRIYGNMVDLLNRETELLSKENKKLNKDIINQKRVKYLFQGTTIVGGIFILISLL